MPRKRKILSQPIGAELLQSNFIVNNSTKVFHTPTVEKIIDEAMPLLRAKKGAQAEILFRKALTLEPVQPDLLNNLAQALELQGLVDDGLCILRNNSHSFSRLSFRPRDIGDSHHARRRLRRRSGTAYAHVCTARVSHRRI
jgi:hypothetical protein